MTRESQNKEAQTITKATWLKCLAFKRSWGREWRGEKVPEPANQMTRQRPVEKQKGMPCFCFIAYYEKTLTFTHLFFLQEWDIHTPVLTALCEDQRRTHSFFFFFNVCIFVSFNNPRRQAVQISFHLQMVKLSLESLKTATVGWKTQYPYPESSGLLFDLSSTPRWDTCSPSVVLHQQHQQLGELVRYVTSQANPALLTLKFLGWGPAMCILQSLTGHSSVWTDGLETVTPQVDTHLPGQLCK